MAPRSAIWLDGLPTSSLPLPDRGLDFGDGLFETFLLQGGDPLYPDLHLQRLERGCRVLAFPDCLDTASRCLESAAADIHRRGWSWTALRLSVLRLAGERGYAPGEASGVRVLVHATELERDCGQMAAAARVSLAGIRLAEQPAFAGIKHMNRLEQVMAAAAARGAGMDESLLLDQDDRLACVVAGNLFLVQGRELYTPALAGCGVHGTRRRLVIERWAPKLGLTVKEAELTCDDLENAGEVFYSNSLYTVRPVARVGALSWAEHPVCTALFNAFRDDCS